MPVTAPPLGRCRVVRLHNRPCHCMHAIHAGMGSPDEAKPQSLGSLGLYGPADVRQMVSLIMKLIY